MYKFNFEDVAKGFLALVVFIGVAIGTTALTADHKPDGYYVSRGGNNGTDATSCVWSHWNWHEDEKAYCSDSIDNVVKVYHDLAGR